MRGALAQRGVALVTAMLIVAIAAAIAAQVVFAHQVWMRQMENAADRGATDWLRRGALHWVSTALIDDASRGSVDHLGERWAQGLPVLPVEGGFIRVALEDAQGRFNLNNLLRNKTTSAPDIAIFRRLLAGLLLDPALAEAVVDWMDDDEQARPGGAEDTDYLAANPPYRTGNQRLASVEEMRLVRGFDAKTFDALAPYVTVLPADSDVNLNTASPQLLAALVPGLDMASAQRIVEARQETPLQNTGALAKLLPPNTTAPTAGVSVKTDFFLVAIDTQIGRLQRRTEALVHRDAGGKSTGVEWHRVKLLSGAT